MAGEYDEKFEKLTTAVERVVGRVDELTLEMRDMRKDLRANTTQLESVTARLGSLEIKVDVLSGQFTDVAGMAIKDHSRIDNLKERVEVLESGTH